MKIHLALLVTSMLAAPSLWAEKPKQKFGEFLDVVEVEVPVHVSLEGRAVRGLTAESFELFDGRKRVALSGFSILDLESAEEVAPVDLPTAARRQFLLLFDLSFAEPDSVVRARAAAHRLVEDALHPSDLVGVATYSIRSGARIVLGFSPDREQVHAAIESLGLPQLLEVQRDPLGLMLADSGDLADLGAEQAESPPTGRTAALVETLKGFARDSRRAVAEADRPRRRAALQQNALAFSASFTELGRMLQAAEGRKHLILLSEGFDSSVLFGTQDVESLQRMNRASEQGQTWEIDSDERFGSTSTLAVVDRMIREFQRANVVVHSVDIGGLRADGTGRSKSEESLYVLADGTGGELLSNFNDPALAMEQILDRTSVTYLLRFQPKKLSGNGAYRRLRVKLVDGPRKARIAHRPGYFEPKPFAQQTPIERQLRSASSILGGPDGGAIQGAVLATPFSVAGERDYVPVLIEVDGRTLLEGHRGSALNLEIFAYAFDRDGRVGDYFSHALGFDLARVGSKLRSDGLKYYGHFDLEPGTYSVRVMLRDSDSGRSSLRSASVGVPAPGDRSAAVSAPLFPDSTERLMVREPPARQNERSVPYPFMAKDSAYIPAARPTIQGASDVAFYLVARNLGTAQGALARLVGEDGTIVARPAVEILEVVQTGGMSRLAAQLDSESLPEGRYILEVELSTETGTARSAIPVLVARSP